jgi:hypothetical protein
MANEKFKKTSEYLADAKLAEAIETGNVVVLAKIPGSEAGKIHVLLGLKGSMTPVAEALALVGRNIAGRIRRTALFNLEATAYAATLPEGSVIPTLTIIRQQFSSKSKRALRDGNLRIDPLPYMNGVAVDKDGDPVWQEMIVAMKGTKDQESIVAGAISNDEFQVYLATHKGQQQPVGATVQPAGNQSGNRPQEVLQTTTEGVQNSSAPSEPSAQGAV